MKKWLFLCLILCGCSERIVHFTSPNTSFKDFNSFGISYLKSNQNVPSLKSDAQLNKIETAVIAEMTKRNYVKNVISPDLIVRYELISSQKTENLNNQSAFAPTFNNPINIGARVLDEYALLIELIQRSKSKTVWQASVDLRQYSSGKKKDKVIEQAVESLFSTYLHKAGSNNEFPELAPSKKK